QASPRPVSLVDYEAVGESSPFATFLPPNLPAEQRRWLAGGPGGGNERPWSPHGRGEICGTDAPPSPAHGPTPWGCTRLFDLRHCPGDSMSRPTHPDPPRRPFVRTSSGDSGLSHADRPSCELTRRAPLGRRFSRASAPGTSGPTCPSGPGRLRPAPP